MTKYEWETELKKNIQKLPKVEQDKIFEYYNELFADKIELGRTEQQAIIEFGNPNDVAYKIMSDYENENGKNLADNVTEINRQPIMPTKMPEQAPVKSESAATGSSNVVYGNAQTVVAPQIQTVSQVQTAPQNTNSNKSSGKTILFVIMIILFGGLMLGLAITVGVIFLVYPIVMGSMLLAGVAEIIEGLTLFTSGAAVSLYTIGTGVFAFGLGLLMVFFIKKVYKGAVKVFGAIHNLFFGWYYKKKGEMS